MHFSKSTGAYSLAPALACVEKRIQKTCTGGSRYMPRALGGFRAATFVRHGKGFCSLRRETRVSVAEDWAYGGWHLRRMLFRPIRSVVLLGFFEQPEVATAFSSAARTARRLASSA